MYLKFTNIEINVIFIFIFSPRKTKHITLFKVIV